MPQAPLSYCTFPGGCGRRVRSGRCSEHKKDTRPSASQRGYGAEWRKRRAAYLERFPNCEDCGAPATDVDHGPSRRSLVRMGVPDPDADEFLHSRCHACHSRKTAKSDGGFGRARSSR